MPTPTASASQSTSTRASASGTSTAWLIGGVLAVLGVLTLTRLQLFAIHENERDALRLLEVLSTSLKRAPAEPNLRAALELTGAAVPRAAPEGEWLEAGGLLRWHGYLFDLGFDRGELVLRAWPWRQGRTGYAAFAYGPHLGWLGHENRGVRPERAVLAAERLAGVPPGQLEEPRFGAPPHQAAAVPSASGPWSGLERRPAVTLGEDWRRLPAP